MALAQTLSCALAEGAGASCSDSLQRLLVEVFDNNIAAFRCCGAWQPGVAQPCHDQRDVSTARPARLSLPLSLVLLN